MNHIFLGMLFIFLDFNLNLGSHTIGLIPDVAGYILLMKGLDTMACESESFTKAKPWALSMAIYTGILYVMDLFALPAAWGFVNWLLGLGSTVISLVISHRIICGIQDIEQRTFRDLQSQKLKTMWTAMAVIQGLCYLTAWIPLVGTMGALAAFILGICYLVAFNKTKNLYLEMP